VKYGKALAAVLFAALTAAYQIVHSGGSPDAVGWVQIAIAATTAAGVYLVPITPEYPWVKSAIGALGAVLQVLTTVIVGGLQTDEILMLLLAVGTAFGVYGSPAGSGQAEDGGPAVSVGVGDDSLV
jgi:hypothetical protein